MKEIWKSVVGFEGLYEVSDQGRVRSLVKRNNRWKPGVLSPSKTHDGYLRVCLYKDGHGKTFKVHRLVACAFLPNPLNLPEVNHINEDKTNNSVENIEWCDRKYNVDYSQSKAVHQIDLTTGKVLATFKSISEAERQTGIYQSNICFVCSGRHKSAGGYYWRFA